jgi:DNA ligase (NAD+)
VERVVEKNELGNTTWKMPETCPSCGSELVRRGAHQFCIRPSCPDQVRGRIRFFVGRNQMDIDNLGPETLDVLIEQGLVQDVQDLYTFDPEKLLELPGFGEKKVRLIREGLEKSKQRGYRNVLVSLGIPDIGGKAVELLTEGGYRDIDALLAAAGKEEPAVFTEIHGIGEKIARTLIEELNNPVMRRRIQALRAAGLSFSEEVPSEKDRPPRIFHGQTWCVTGSFDHFKPRELAMEEVKKRGGRVTSAVTAKTTHLLAGPGAGSKLEKARELGTRIVDEAEFLNMLQTS